MRRREFITLLGGAALVWPLVARAQQHATDGMRQIGMLVPRAATDPEAQRFVNTLAQALEHLGWTDGRNIRIDHGWNSGGDPEQARAAAKELVSLAPNVIAVYRTPDLAAVRQETQTIPIVFVSVTDPVGQGFVASLAHPGGNITGFAAENAAMGSKWLELLKEIAPNVTRVALLFNPKTAPFSASILQSIEAAAPSLAVRATAAPVYNATDIEDAIIALARESNAGLIVASDAFALLHRDLIITLAAQHRLPAVYPLRAFAPRGGLITYAPDLSMVRVSDQAATYIDRILRGAKPADLPVQEPTKFDLVINLKTAKALGLTVPQSILARADEVIE